MTGYIPTNWIEKGMSTDQKVNGLNNLETIHDKSIAYMNAMTHDVYTIAEADAKYYRTSAHPSGRSDTGHGCGINAATVDGYTLAQILAAAVPAGAFGMWKEDALPNGYVECDGLNDTPDLRGYLLRGAGSGLSPGTIGGSNTATPTAPNFDSANHLLTDNEIPRHQHPYNDRTNEVHNTTNNPDHYVGYSPDTNLTKTTLTTEPGGITSRTVHKHAGCSFSWIGYLDESGVHQGSQDLNIMPANRAVKFIMRSYGN